jgi:hypothetical protein
LRDADFGWAKIPKGLAKRESQPRLIVHKFTISGRNDLLWKLAWSFRPETSNDNLTLKFK